MSAGLFTLTKLQEEMKPWVQHNFGDRPASQPLRGIIEELGEIFEAWDNDCEDEVLADGVADCIIFMADYCNTRGYSLDEIDGNRLGSWHSIHIASDLLQLIGKLAHHDLKLEQGIRKNEDHEREIKFFLSAILDFLEYVVNGLDLDATFDTYLDLVEETWNKVKKRDWKKNAVTG